MQSLVVGVHPEVAEIAREWRDWLAHEKRQAAATVKAYQTDLAGFLTFSAGHLGGQPDLDELAGLSTADRCGSA